MNRKAQGLCFRCGEKYHPLHHCAEQQLRLLVLGDDETVNKEKEIIASEEKEQKEESTLDCGAMGMFGEVEICGNERIIPSTLRLEASINGVFVVVLVDIGASHNFISPHVVVALGLEVENEKPTGV